MKRKLSASVDARFFMLALASAIYLIPILLLILNSFKTQSELVRNPNQVLPQGFQVANYLDAIESIPVLDYLANSLFLCGLSVLGTVISCSMAAYGLSQLRWRGRDLVFVLVVMSLLIPWQITMLPRFVIISRLGFYDSLWAIVLPKFFGDAFFIFLLRQYFTMIPKEIVEAARMDGLNELAIYLKIILPMAAPGLVAVALFQWIGSWNDFQEPLLFLSDPQKFPLAYGLERFVSSYSDQTNLLLAASVLFCIPVFLIFLFTQRYFWATASINSGSKG